MSNEPPVFLPPLLGAPIKFTQQPSLTPEQTDAMRRANTLYACAQHRERMDALDKLERQLNDMSTTTPATRARQKRVLDAVRKDASKALQRKLSTFRSAHVCSR